MKSRYASAAVVVALLLPFTASALSVEEIQQQIRSLLAQLATLQEQIRALQSTPATVPDVARGSCPALFRALSLGTSGSDVLSLQKFLVAQNLLSAEAATGSFEALTQGAVQDLQTKYGVVLSGTPGTTGYGAVGPRTRALIALNCNLPGTTPLSCPFAPPPTTACSTGWQANTDANGCTTSYKCSTPLPTPITSACTAIALSCPYGSHDQVGPNCSHSCVPDTTQSSTLSASPTSGSAPLAVVFSSNVGGGITPYRVDYTIDYGDGVREAAANCYAPSDYCISPGKNTHTYTNTGTYTATLTMTKYNNCQATGDSVCAAWVSSTGTLGTVTITVGGQTSSASLNISSPNAGQSYAIGQNMTISWNSTNAPAGSEVRLYLLNSKGQYVSNGIGSGQSSASYQWTVPSMVINTDIGMSLQPGSYRIEARLIPSDSCVVMHPGGGCRPGTTQRDPYAVTSSGMFSITASAGGVKCKEDLTALDAYNASQPSGTICGQGGPSLRCPYDSSVVYGSLSTCATGFLQQRGWVSVSSSGNTNTNLANALSALEALLKKFLGQ